MKGIIKVRNFDSLQKMSTKRAYGKWKNLQVRMAKIKTSIMFLEEHDLLTIDMLWDILLIYLEYQKEAGKLYYVYTYARADSWYKANDRLFTEFTDDHVNCYIETVFANGHHIVMNLPYELHKKYRDIMMGREQELELKNKQL